MSKNQLVSNEELILSNMLEIQAMTKILIRKGITTENEILDELRKVQSEMNDQINKSKKLN